MKLKDIERIVPYRFYTHEEANNRVAMLRNSKKDCEFVGITQVIEKQEGSEMYTVAYDLWVMYKKKKEK